MTDDELVTLQLAVHGELSRRALERADLGALTEEGFTMFTASGLPDDPYVRSGLLVCLGAKNDKSAMSHACGFARVGEQWAWECDDLILDTVRHLPGPKTRMRSVTIVAPPIGTPVDLVSAKTKNGVHSLSGVRSFVMTETGLEIVSTRAVKPVSHRS